MKQTITKDDLLDLGDRDSKLYKFLLNWCVQAGYRTFEPVSTLDTLSTVMPIIPELTIGQLIEFLYQHVTVVIESEERESPNQGWELSKYYSALELVDALWDQVKDVVKKEAK